MKVGFIGLGNMGRGMAANLVKAGHEVTVYNRTRGKAQALVELGAREAATVAEACRGDAVITMLAEDGAVESVVLARPACWRSLGKARCTFPRAPSALRWWKRWRRRTRRAGQRLVAAPVFGRSGGSGGGEIVCGRGGRAGRSRRLHAAVDAIGQKNVSLWRQAAGRRAGEAEWKLFDLRGD